jgi:hypothetical protein
MPTIIVPSTLDLEKVLAFVALIDELPADNHYSFDFKPLRWVYPFGMLFIAQAVKRLRTRYSGCTVRCINLNTEAATSYAGHMGFFQACGFPEGNEPSFKSNSLTYIPITYVRASQIRTRQAIESIAQELAEQLTLQSSGSLFDALRYSFREIIRNVVEHSEADVFAYCAQYWPTRDLVELAILDTGIGLWRSLSHNPHLQLNSDQDAIKHALMPGISGKTYQGVKLRPDDVWQNSGYGLYMNYRLCNEGGSFFICSGTRGLLRSDGSANRYFETSFQGTALRLKLKVDHLRDVERMLKKFSDEGEVVARQIGMGAIPNASTMSRMLKDNFKVDYKIEVGDTVKHRQFGEGQVTEKFKTPQGEMLWVSFKGGRRKKVLSSAVAVINEDTYTYDIEDLEMYDTDDTVLIDFDELYSDVWGNDDEFFDI